MRVSSGLAATVVSGFCSRAVEIFWIFNVDFSINKFTRYEKLSSLNGHKGRGGETTECRYE